MMLNFGLSEDGATPGVNLHALEGWNDTENINLETVTPFPTVCPDDI